MTQPAVRYIAGLDLGRPHEFTALAVLERTEQAMPSDPSRSVHHYAVRHLERLPPATPLPEVFARLAEVFATPPLRDSRLVVDYTGVVHPHERLYITPPSWLAYCQIAIPRLANPTSFLPV